MRLTQAEVDYQAQKASWYIQVNFNDINVGGDVYIVTGDSTEDLDRLISMMPIYPKGIFEIDLGRQYEIWKRCDIEDIIAIRDAYLAYYGDGDRPGFPPELFKAIELL